MRLLLDHAAENNYGIPAFNVNNMEQIQAILKAADETNSPVILQASRGARSYAGENFLRHLILAAVETYPHLPIVMHQDHGNAPSTCYSAIKNGFTSVMMDGSLEADAKTPASYEYNVAVTSEVVKVALAVAIGTSHGAYKFTRKPTGEILAISRIEEIHNRLPNTHLVMHGSSSVPEDLLAMINEFGGAIPETYGVPVEEIQKGIKSGVRKVNIDTDCRLAITAAVREALSKAPKEFDPRHFLKPSIKYMQKVCADRYIQFEAAGQASKIKQIGLDEFAAKYAKGELNVVTAKSAVSV
jgi:fructose-bisphosphate aldolase class II